MMLLRHLLCALFAVTGVFPRVMDVAQVPLLPEAQHRAKPQHLGVMIAFKRRGEDHEATVRFPLRQPMRGSLLQYGRWNDAHKQIDTMTIVAVVDMETGMSGSLEELARVKCRVEPSYNAEEIIAASTLDVEMGTWPHFGVEDGTVHFRRSESKWFLASRLIEKVECW